MKKVLPLILTFFLLLSSVGTASAADNSRECFFELSVDGSDTKQVQPGDVITVAFYLNRTDSSEPYDMYAMQNEIRYDSRFFRLVEGSALLTDGIQSNDLGLRDEYREFYMNFVSMSGGEKWEARRLVGSIQLEVIGQTGVSKITNQDYLVSTADGQDHYEATCQDVTIIISTDCTVSFASNGGTEVADQVANYGEKVQRPEDPVRKGYHIEGWYTDIDLKDLWDFENDTVQGNMTLYAKWAEGDPAGGFPWLWLVIGLLLLALLLLLLLLLLGKKTVSFETGCRAKVKSQKVKKGGCVRRPKDPIRMGRTFAGWYRDEGRMEKWDFENDRVEENMTLYAKWM